jgi:hypothetical protein
MNPGYLSLLLLSITLVLFASGWKDLYLRSISHKRILLFFIAWLVLSGLSISINHIKINMDYLLVACVSICILVMAKGFIHKLHLLSIGLLLGSFHFLLQEILTTDPVMVTLKPEWDTALFLALLTIVLQRGELEQIACLSIGFLMGDFYNGFVHKATAPLYFGSSAFQDEWWLSVFAARTTAIVLQSAHKGCKSVIRSWQEWKGGWKK